MEQQSEGLPSASFKTNCQEVKSLNLEKSNPERSLKLLFKNWENLLTNKNGEQKIFKDPDWENQNRRIVAHKKTAGETFSYDFFDKETGTDFKIVYKKKTGIDLIGFGNKKEGRVAFTKDLSGNPVIINHPQTNEPAPFWKSKAKALNVFYQRLKKNNMLSTALAGGISILITVLAACSQAEIIPATTAISETPQTQAAVSFTSTPNPTPTPTETPTPYDYCALQLNQDEDPISSLRAGTPIPPETLTEGNLEAIRSINLTTEDIVSDKENSPSEKLQIVLVPVGYSSPEEIREIMEYFTINLPKIYQEVNMNFSYLNRSLPIGIQKQSRRASLINPQEAEITLEKVKTIYPADRLVIVVNSPEIAGDGANPAIVTTKHSFALSAIAHEIGHLGGNLTDSYPAYLPPESFANNTELFTSTETLPDRVKIALAQLNPPIFDTGNQCLNWKVYSFYGSPESNLMGYLFTDNKIREMIDKGQPIFNPVQISAMNSYISSIKQPSNHAISIPQ